MTTSHLLVQHHKDPGRVRDYQEDDCRNFAIRAGEYHLLVVADGMGGHSHGDVASKMAIEALAQFLDYGTWDEPARALRQGFAIANERVHSQGVDMGTTLTAVLFEEATSQYWWANVGDSRAYLLEGETLHQLSRDHSEIQVRVDAGQLTAEDARLAKGRNVLLKAIGPTERVEADVEGPYELVPGQRLLLCSDGLHGMLSEPELAAIAGHDLQVVAKDLVAAANVAGGRDNISALVAALSDGEATQFMGVAPAVAAKPTSKFGRLSSVGRRTRVAIASVVVGVLGLGAAVAFASIGGEDPRPATTPTPSQPATFTPTAKGTVTPTRTPSPTPTHTPTPTPTSTVTLAPSPTRTPPPSATAPPTTVIPSVTLSATVPPTTVTPSVTPSATVPPTTVTPSVTPSATVPPTIVTPSVTPSATVPPTTLTPPAVTATDTKVTGPLRADALRAIGADLTLGPRGQPL